MNNFVDNTPLEFGKFRGKTPNEIAEIEPSYIVWMYDNLDEKFVTRALRDLCEEAMYENYESEKEKDWDYGFDGW
jgi:hypothetical protein